MDSANNVEFRKKHAAEEENHFPAAAIVREPYKEKEEGESQSCADASQPHQREEEYQRAAKLDRNGPQMHVVACSSTEWLPAPDVNEIPHMPDPIPKLVVEGGSSMGMVFKNVPKKLFVLCKRSCTLVPTESQHYYDHEGRDSGRSEEAQSSTED